MGVVYRAWDRDAQRMVALKIIQPGVLEEARFRFEAGVLARLEHENVIPLHEVGEHEEVPYYTMRFVEGGDLGGRLAACAVRVKIYPYLGKDHYQPVHRYVTTSLADFERAR
jgi:serine/threonine protein kinase